MSETPVGSDEVSGNPNEKMHDALIGFTGCVGEALDDICSYGLTIGDSYVPFNPDEDDDCTEEEVACSQAWVRVTNVGVKYVSDSFESGGCGGVFAIDLEVGVLRCFGIEEEGEAPTASDVLVAATQAMDDMRAIYCAAMNCEVWDSITAGQWSPMGPAGGQYGGTWTFSVEF